MQRNSSYDYVYEHLIISSSFGSHPVQERMDWAGGEFSEGHQAPWVLEQWPCEENLTTQDLLSLERREDGSREKPNSRRWTGALTEVHGKKTKNWSEIESGGLV